MMHANILGVYGSVGVIWLRLIVLVWCIVVRAWCIILLVLFMVALM